MKNVNLKEIDNHSLKVITIEARMHNVNVPKHLWYLIEKAEERNAPYFVFFDRSNVEILEVPEYRSASFAKIVEVRRFRGMCLYVKRGIITQVSRVNWDEIKRGIMPKRAVERDEREEFARKSEADKMFADALPVERYRKPSKRGFRRTFDANYRQEFPYLGAAL